ncbi:CGNR zinc finger domain-containing protein [Priestia megaterium]|uniref:hypothetical protein n=1 Tax=Priestia megaterium TaxID=1404 RepID=UPI0039E09BE1
MDLLFNTIHLPEQIKLSNASILSEMNLESILSNHERKGIRGELFNSEFKKFYGFQLSKGRGVIENYEFFIKQLIDGDIPCLFFLPQESLPVRKDTKGIATRFASLKTDKDIINFAKEYGLLGVLAPSFKNTDYGVTVFEPLYFWKFYIKEVKQILKLYKMLEKKHRNQDIDIIGELIDYKENKEDGSAIFKWNDGGSIPFSHDEEELDDYEDYDQVVGVNIFTTLVRNGLKNAINVDFSDVVEAKDSRMGFRIKEVYSTNYLLGAIYYDLWQLINEDVEIKFCDHCGRPFKKFGKKRFCGTSCRVMSWTEDQEGEK